MRTKCFGVEFVGKAMHSNKYEYLIFRVVLTFFYNLESGYLVLFWAIAGEELENCSSQVLVLCFRSLFWYVVPRGRGGTPMSM